MKFNKTVTERGTQLVITCRLDDGCGNGHETFSLTAHVYEQQRGKWVDVGGGCYHDDIVRMAPEFGPFARLHLSDMHGVPMHAAANGLYWLAGVCGGLGQEYHGGSGRDGKSREECRGILMEHLRISEDDVATLIQSSPRTERELVIVLERMGLVDQWKREADAAIRQLEEWTGQTFTSAATRATWTPSTEEERATYAERLASGFYSPAAVAARDAAKADAKKRKLLAGILEDYEEATRNAAMVRDVELALVGHFGFKPNAILYTHNRTLSFNWCNITAKVSREEFDGFVAAATLPAGVGLEFKD